MIIVIKPLFGIKMELLERMLNIFTIARWGPLKFTTQMAQSKKLKILDPKAVLSHST